MSAERTPRSAAGPALHPEARELAARLGHEFERPSLLLLALTHRSAIEGGGESYERLEFLGDAVLGLVAVEWLCERRPDATEGDLARTRAYLVSRKVLAGVARRLGLGEALLLSGGEERSGGRHKSTLLADSLEAVIGALYLDGGLERARGLIEPWLAEALARDPDLAGQDAKTRLQEIVQARAGSLPEYRLVAEEGPDHDKRFSVECWIGGERMGEGSGGSKKVAERRAALQALHVLAEENARVRPDSASP
ncbi:MAG TPA: ribonuclease III [Thermoanaerobaculia bacterium]|nr:ribonuclease III [Thermoanaerobaculia bacterium]